MSEKTMTDLMIRFMSDEGFRCKMLHREDAGLTAWGLPHPKRIDAIQLDRGAIVKHIVDEITSATPEAVETWLNVVFEIGGVDLDAARAEIHGSAIGPMAASAYSQGGAHIRGIEPSTVSAGVETMLEIRGQGFTHSLKVKALGPGQSVDAEVISQSCDVDLNQRVVVRVTIPTPGQNWAIEVDPNFETDNPDRHTILVVP